MEKRLIAAAAVGMVLIFIAAMVSYYRNWKKLR